VSGALFETPAGLHPPGPAGQTAGGLLSGEGGSPLAQPALTITVYGIPAPQGSKHGRPIYKGRGQGREFTGKVAQVESSKKVKPWREAVKWAALRTLDCSFALEIGGGDHAHMNGSKDPRTCCDPPLDGPLRAEFVFSFARPKAHYRTGRNAHLLRGSAPPYPSVIPDLSKLIRSTEDALTDAGVWADDARVVAYHQPRKVYAGGPDPDALAVPGALIRIWELT
jgi:endodeoxyribonuclease RusA